MMLEQELLSRLRIEDGVAYWRERANSQVSAGGRAGWVDRRGYTYIGQRGRSFLLHRLVFLDRHGYLPEMVDHIDGNPANNRAENLRAATPSQNLRNAKRPKDNTSGVKNVHWDRRRQRWWVRLRIDGRGVFFGYYDTLEEAAVAAEQARRDSYGEFARHA